MNYTEADIAKFPLHIRAQIEQQIASQPRRSGPATMPPAEPEAPFKESKYRNIKCEIDGYLFDSKREGKRYLQLKSMMLAGLICDLELQPEFLIEVNGVSICSYLADFRYWHIAGNRRVIEDVKGVRTDLYRLKKKLVEALYGITITEVK